MTFHVQTSELNDLERFVTEYTTDRQDEACAVALSVAQRLMVGADSRLVRVWTKQHGVVVDPVTIARLARDLLKEAQDAIETGKETGGYPVRRRFGTSELLRGLRPASRNTH
jgi:hypothetical protein